MNIASGDCTTTSSDMVAPDTDDLKRPGLSALSQGLASCSTCGALSHTDQPIDTALICPRCGAAIRARKLSSLTRTWAFLIAACILYIPANLLPVMYVTALGKTSEDTIMSGVIVLWNMGSYGISALIFIASFIVPLSKLLALTLLLITVHRQSVWGLEQRAKLYRMVEFIGKWSMLDVFVVTLLTALVHFGSLMSIHIGHGALAFGSVVILTMLASHSFDPRLTWDSLETVKNT